MAYEKNICGDCEHFSDTGRCRIPQVKHQDRAFFSKACVWFKQYQSHTDMEKSTVKKGANNNTPPTMEKKKCSTCGEEKPVTEFQRNRWGYTSICKECHTKKVSKTLKDGGKGPSAGPSAEQAGTKTEVKVKRINAHYSDEVKADVLRDTSDEALVHELRARGWEITATKEITQTITL